MQIFILTNNEIGFKQQINIKLNQGHTVIPGSMFVASTNIDSVFSLALWHKDGQIFLINGGAYVFSNEVNELLRRGYKAIPGTTYFKNLSPPENNKLLTTHYSILLNKG